MLDDDGNVIASVHGRHPLSPGAEAAMRDLIGAVHRRLDNDPEMAAMLERQAERQKLNHARLVRLGIADDNADAE